MRHAALATAAGTLVLAGLTTAVASDSRGPGERPAATPLTRSEGTILGRQARAAIRRANANRRALDALSQANGAGATADPAGPPGPQGPPGPRGAPGPEGPPPTALRGFRGSTQEVALGSAMTTILTFELGPGDRMATASVGLRDDSPTEDAGTVICQLSIGGRAAVARVELGDAPGRIRETALSLVVAERLREPRDLRLACGRGGPGGATATQATVVATRLAAIEEAVPVAP